MFKMIKNLLSGSRPANAESDDDVSPGQPAGNSASDVLEDGFEEYHSTANKKQSDHIVDLFSRAGIATVQRHVTRNRRTEFIVAIPHDDLDKADAVFWADVGPHKSLTSSDG